MWSGQCEVGCVELAMWSWPCEVGSVELAMWRGQCEVVRVEWCMWSGPCGVVRVECPCGVDRVKCAVWMTSRDGATHLVLVTCLIYGYCMAGEGYRSHNTRQQK